ncbi:MAG TPA: hypothetical protein VM285_05900, partial [Polyangia bacterium]|nr:hypothetical protein [Polyangia bacterium]
SDLLFQSRRAPTAALLYGLLVLASVAMVFALARPATVVEDADPKSGLVPGDRILEIAGREVDGWSAVRDAVACWPASCEKSRWDSEGCTCSTAAGLSGDEGPRAGAVGIPAVIERGGDRLALELPDPAPLQRAGDKRRIGARPVLPISPLWLGAIAFLMSLCVIGTHGLLSGTATMDFGGRKGAATAVGVIDGFVYLGTAIQSISLGYITSVDWAYWPVFLVPFGAIGLFLLIRIWNAMPAGRQGGH